MKRKVRQLGLQILFGPKYWLWRYDIRQLFYVTPYIPRLQMTKCANMIYKDHFPGRDNLVIWDMFGGIGTDSIYLGSYFNVITTELDPHIYDLLRQNLKIQGTTNVQAIHSNCLKLLNVVKPDIIYFDPPWGDHYQTRIKNFDFRTVNLELLPEIPEINLYPEVKQATSIKSTNLVQYLLTHVTSYMVIKSPFNSQTFEELFEPYITYIYRYPKKNLKFLFLVPPSVKPNEDINQLSTDMEELLELLSNSSDDEDFDI